MPKLAHILIEPVQPAPPPSFADIMKSFAKDGNGDAKTLLAILSAKQAEEDVSPQMFSPHR